MLKPVQIVPPPDGSIPVPAAGVVNTEEISTVEAVFDALLPEEAMRVTMQNGEALTVLGKPSDLIP